jgi:hypothetical protein
MSGWSAGSPNLRRTPLAIGLCLLAILFAIEAKTAWYGPLLGPGGNISAAKALPVALPELVDHGVPSPDPTHPGVVFTVLPASTTAWLPRVKVPAFGEIRRNHLFSFTAYFSPAIFFRPPPVF